TLALARRCSTTELFPHMKSFTPVRSKRATLTHVQLLSQRSLYEGAPLPTRSAATKVNRLLESPRLDATRLPSGVGWASWVGAGEFLFYLLQLYIAPADSTSESLEAFVLEGSARRTRAHAAARALETCARIGRRRFRWSISPVDCCSVPHRRG